MILTHESGSQDDQFDEKKWRQKISWDYPFNKKIYLFVVTLRSNYLLFSFKGSEQNYWICINIELGAFLVRRRVLELYVLKSEQNKTGCTREVRF